MDFSASGGCHQRIHQVPRRSSVSSEHLPKLRLSGLFSFIPAGARLFCLGMLALLLTLPCTHLVGAVTSAFNGFQESDVYMMSDSPWTIESNTNCFFFDPPEASWYYSVPGRFLYPYRVQMKDPVTKQVKSFRSTIKYEIDVQKANTSAIGNGKTFYVYPENPTLGAAAEDYLELLNADTSTSAKNYEFNNYTLGVELDTFKNSEFNNPSDNHIGVNLASMLSTFIVDPLYTVSRYVVHTHIWIDYSEVDSRMDIYIGIYGKGKPVTPQWSQTGIDLSLLLENVGFSTAKGIELDNLPCVQAWRFSNAAFEYPSVSLIDFANTLFPGQGRFPSSRPLPPSPTTRSPGRTPTTKKGKSFNLWNSKYLVLTILLIVTIAIILVVGMFGLLGQYKVFQRTCIDIEKRRRCTNQRAEKEIGVMTYINKLLRLLFAFSGLLIILLSVILDYYVNDKPLRFTTFTILAPIMIFLGYLASGWFPRIPLQFIAFVKQCGLLQHLVPCSPWHDNVVIDFCGKICTLESFEQEEGKKPLDFPMSIHNFLYGDRFPLQRPTHTTYSQSLLDSDIRDYQVATSLLKIQGQDIQTLNPQSQDFKTSNVLDQAVTSEILEHPQVVMATGQVSSPNLHEVPSQVEDIVFEIDCSQVFHILGNEQVSILEFDGPKINGFPFKVHAFKNMLTRDHSFDLSCTFRNKKTRKMNLTTERLSNLVQNMYQWLKRPYPVVVDKSSDILHCIAIQDILWAFTKGVYTFNSIHVKHHFLAGMEEEGSIIFVSLSLVSLVMSVISLVWDKTSNWFLFFLIVLVVYMLTSMDIPYYLRSLFCPIYMKYKDFRRLYKSKSSFIWCNEFRKKKIVNPTSFWIDQEYANKLLDADSCFNMGELVMLPGNPFRGESFKITCQGWPEDDPKKQHDYELEVNFDTFNPDDTRYTSVKLSFSENGDPLGTRKYSFVEIQRLQLIEKLFYCYSNPSFGGYIETIRPCSWSQSYLGSCRRFLDIYNKIITDSTMPIPWEAATKSDSQFIIGVPF